MSTFAREKPISYQIKRSEGCNFQIDSGSGYLCLLPLNEPPKAIQAYRRNDGFYDIQGKHLPEKDVMDMILKNAKEGETIISLMRKDNGNFETRQVVLISDQEEKK